MGSIVAVWCVYTVFDLIQCARWMQKNECRVLTYTLALANQHFYGWFLDSCHVLLFEFRCFFRACFTSCRPHHYTRSYSHTTNTIIVVCINFVLFRFFWIFFTTFILISHFEPAFCHFFYFYFGDFIPNNTTLMYTSKRTSTYQINDSWFWPQWNKMKWYFLN